MEEQIRKVQELEKVISDTKSEKLTDIVKAGSVYAGVPAKFLRKTDPTLIEGQIKRIAESYSMYASWYQ